MARPSNFFRTVDGVQVLYDRLNDDYGKTGIPYKFYATQNLEDKLDAFIAEIRSETEDLFGPLQTILSAGAYVDKSGAHGLGRAFDLDALIWRDKTLVADQQPSKKPLYLLVQAIASKRFGVVLGYNYNAAHEDHFHLDDSRTVKFRTSQSVTNFMQEALILFWSKNIARDGEWGHNTKTAFKEVIDDLGLSYPPSPEDWAAFCDAVVDEARFMLGAGEDGPFYAVGGIDAEDDDPEVGVVSDPQAAATDAESEGVGGAPFVLSLRPTTGRPDLSYEPLSGWSISKRSSGITRWYLSTDTISDLYLGYDFEFKDDPPFRGLARTGDAPNSAFYDADAYRAKYGAWADFVVPTGKCESEGNFCVVNAWDRAAFTLGFFQMAAHTGKHMANLFRDIWRTLPNEAEQFFPEIKLGSQIGHGKPDELFAVNGSDKLSLDVAERPADGHAFASWYRGRFMDFFNPDRASVGAEEVQCAARWQAWLQNSKALQDVIVDNAVAIAKSNVRELHKLVGGSGLSAYPNGLDGVSMAICSAAMDTKHHGRRNRDKGHSVSQSILNSLKTKEPLKSFAFIDTGWREDRSKRVVSEIKKLKSAFDGKVYDAANENFR